MRELIGREVQVYWHKSSRVRPPAQEMVEWNFSYQGVKQDKRQVMLSCGRGH